MTVPTQTYKPISTPAVEIAVVTTSSSATVTTVRIYLRAQSTLATPETFVTDNALEHEVVSQAGLAEATTFTSYAAISSTTYGDEYVYIVDATVSTS